MTKTISIDWKGGSRRIELQSPDEKIRMHQLATAPTPLTMTPSTLAWITQTIEMGCELDKQAIESMPLVEGYGLLTEILGYWGSLMDDDSDGGSEKGSKVDVEGLELNEDGSVELEDMR